MFFEASNYSGATMAYYLGSCFFHPSETAALQSPPEKQPYGAQLE